MKKILVLALSMVAAGAFAQGTIKFYNSSSSTPITVGGAATSTSGSWGTANSFYFALFTAAANSTDATLFTDSGAPLAANNTGAAGAIKVLPLTGVTAPNVAINSTRAVLVRGWSANLGSTWAAVSAQWNNGVNSNWSAEGYFGQSSIAPAVIFGGLLSDGVSTIPAGAAFGGSGANAGIQSGFDLAAVHTTSVPEPASFALAGLGAAALVIFRRRK